MVYGTRTVNLDATMEFNDIQCGLKAVITFGPTKKKGWFRKQQGTLDEVKGEITHGEMNVSNIEGSWLQGLRFNGLEYWNIDTHRPQFHLFVDNPLPSDWRFREDLLWLGRGQIKPA